MSDISHVTVDGSVYDLKDAVARALGGPGNPLRLPLLVERNGVKYSCDIADDADGIDWVLSRSDAPRPAAKLPLFLTDGERLYRADISDDADGIDWNITKIQ